MKGSEYAALMLKTLIDWEKNVHNGPFKPASGIDWKKVSDEHIFIIGCMAVQFKKLEENIVPALDKLPENTSTQILVNCFDIQFMLMVMLAHFTNLPIGKESNLADIHFDRCRVVFEDMLKGIAKTVDEAQSKMPDITKEVSRANRTTH